MTETYLDQFYSLKIQSQTPTETSSEFNGECFSMKLSQQDIMNVEQQTSQKKQQNKLKYRKLKQKLNNMGSTHDEKCVAVKQIGGPSKQKIMKLAIDFQRQVKMQNRDYYYLQTYSRQLLKYLQSKNQQQLHLLRQSRMMPAIFQLLQKVPMLHKNEFNQVLKTLQTCKQKIFTVLSINRDYLILTNRLNNLISLINWMAGKEEKRPGYTFIYNTQFLCFKVVNVLLNHRCKEENAENVNSIINTTLQLILCSQIFKKIKYAACQQLIQEDSSEIQQTELVQEMLKFLLIVLRKSHSKKESIDSLVSKGNQFSVYNYLKINPQLIKSIEFILPSFVSYFIQLYDSEDFDEDQDSISFPNIILNLLNLAMKILNVCFEVSYVLFKKIFRDIERQPFFVNFLNKMQNIIIYCKRQYQEQDSNNNAKMLLNQIIVFLGYIALEDPSVQKKIYESLIFEQISNLPIQFMMDSNLREIITPTICCLIYENKTTLNSLMRDNSPLHIIKYLRKQLQSRPSLQRKNSTTSLMSLAPTPIESGSFSYEIHRNQISLRFPFVFWEQMCLQLEKHA